MGRHLRVLCTSTPGAGHVSALAPVARTLRARGHDVQWAVAPERGAAVAGMGFEWYRGAAARVAQEIEALAGS
jgi:UDP:flavonoid glycosyltransferase YjiC (YdhE family)